jgi:two-component system response regulator HydG
LEDEPHERDAVGEPIADPTTTLFERLEQAHGGALFLDAVDDLSPAAQARLSRALMERETRHEGSGRLIATDVRLIAASRRELLDLVQSGSFREDLFYRLAVVTLRISPLRMRPSDIPLLAMHFLRRFARQNDKRVGRLHEEALDLLTAHSWPGNVRELENALERAVVLATGDTIEPRHLPPSLTRAKDPARAPSIPGASLAEIERYAIIKTLEAQEGKVGRAAKVLGISPRTVQYKLRRYTSPGAPRSASGAH